MRAHKLPSTEPQPTKMRLEHQKAQNAHLLDQKRFAKRYQDGVETFHCKATLVMFAICTDFLESQWASDAAAVSSTMQMRSTTSASEATAESHSLIAFRFGNSKLKTLKASSGMAALAELHCSRMASKSPQRLTRMST